ncbi:hypothetical protein M569_16994, partial [Genlisea aurea]
AVRHLKQMSHEVCLPNNASSRRPAALQALSRRLNRGFNEAVNSFVDEGWSMMESDGLDDVAVHVNSSPGKLTETIHNYSMSNAVLSAKASILLQNVSPAVVLRFLREHRSEWADGEIDAYSAVAAVKAGGSYSLPVSRGTCFGGGHIVLPLGSTFMEVIKLQNVAQYGEESGVPNDVFLLQVYSGVDEGGVGELIFAPIDASFSDDGPLLPSGFRVIPLDAESDPSSPNRTLDLASALEVGSFRCAESCRSSSGFSRSSVVTMAFQFAFGVHLQEGSVAAMARQYVRSVISSVRRVASALSPARAPPPPPPPCFHATPEAQTLASWICSSYRFYLGTEMVSQMERNDGGGGVL